MLAAQIDSGTIEATVSTWYNVVLMDALVPTATRYTANLFRHDSISNPQHNVKYPG